MSYYLKNYLDKLSEKLKQNNKLQEIIDEFILKFNMQPRIGVEIEFYLSDNLDIKQFEDLSKLSVKSENGQGQFEVEISPSSDLISYVNIIESVKINIKNTAEFLGGKAYLTAKPFTNDYGNSIHFHIDFIDVRNNLVADFDIDLAAQSLCHYMKECFLVFMPEEEDYLRIDKNFMSPTHICRGQNNRTVAIRIPDRLPKRLEHRVASPTCDSYLCIYAILKAILLGFKNSAIITSYPIIYGNAFDPQYNITKIPINKQEADSLFNEDFFIL